MAHKDPHGGQNSGNYINSTTIECRNDGTWSNTNLECTCKLI